ncbi:hypothetical protein CO115_03645 [Candidatus Falkowbacteria bacterium CG_4_9_14_3_um_filter_36_9]|uniref:Uncharacterized protein n=1 Tax=Candidatus Falkowbacteria bacterium CG02_land_8_20_14_3_00_36_14 TaxID=1974560 RepID=A0A2M7DQ61_9BACT|nr:MAG: hypothetical protein COS18_01530 [Candidatus Falkowbacteria bacterium CG02_land_8_20_14_3_00_36_14]PIX12271.1 MAG: hypothetical protein COZ73_00555 [Candidatus Falkowbacteria bacterium CG_4_8_14_3_um_filter_36_11]PJA11209.1 MAG: hypothetical protein COX67_00975 [Candidatus Falkowbacteria bacterium CG_4_10_14_0_2_um_filter_36_22]PJB18860.1 MAG: hypothetical protein CO115_03645 [Candidatus Falkowbacteria bacterium CG_4_9_14_3_um_filter_36_9]
MKKGEDMLPNNISKELFGSTLERIKATNNIANKDDLRLPFQNRETVIFIFCKGCGMIYEANEEAANKFLEKGEIISSSFVNKYIKISGCIGCDNNIDEIKLINI